MPTLVGDVTTDVGTGSAASLTLNLNSIAGIAAGDFVILVGEFNVNSETVNVNRSGWEATANVNVSTTLSARSFYKIIDAADLSLGTVTLSVTTNTRCAMGAIAIRDATLDTVAINPVGTSQSVNDTTQPFAGIDPVYNATALVVQAINYAAGGTQVTSTTIPWTRRFNTATTHTSQRRAGVAGFQHEFTSSNIAFPGNDTTSNVNAHSASWTYALVDPAFIPAPAAGAGFLSFGGSAGGRGVARPTGSLSFGGSAGGRGVARPTGSLTLSGASSARGAARPAGVISLSGSSAARGVGDASGSLSLEGSAAAEGEQSTAGVADGSLSLSGSADAAVQGAATGGLSFGGSATVTPPSTILFSEDFEGIADETTLTSTNTAFASTTGVGVRVADTAYAVSGSASARISTTTAGDLSTLVAEFASSDPVFVRFYFRPDFYMVPNPETETNIAELRTTSNVIRAMMEFTENGNIGIKDNSTLVATTTTALPLDQFTRIEWSIDSVTTVQKARLFIGANVHGTVPDEEIAGAYTRPGGAAVLWVGQVRKTYPLTAWWDEVAVASGNWVGPADVAAGGVEATATGFLSLGGSAAGQADPGATGSLTLSGTAGGGRAAEAATGSLTLTGSAAALGVTVASGSLSLASAGSADAPSAATGSLEVVGSSTAQGAASASGALLLEGASSTSGAAVAAGVLTLAGIAATSVGPASAGSLSLSGVAAPSTPVAASGFLALAGQGAVVSSDSSVATGSLSLAGGSAARSTTAGSGTLSLTGSGTSLASTAGAAGALSLTATSTPRTGAVGQGSLSLAGSGASRGTPSASGSIDLSGAGSSAGAGFAAGAIALSGVGAPPAGSAAAVGNLDLFAAATQRAAVAGLGHLHLSGAVASLRVSMWDGTTYVDTILLGEWTGATYAPVVLRGEWDGFQFTALTSA